MSEYIKREDVIEKLTGVFQLQAETAKAIVDDIPAADVVEVVRCKDCAWCHAGYCEKYDDLIPFGCANKPWEDWFCADGKR